MATGQNVSYRNQEGAELRSRLKNIHRENDDLRAAQHNKEVELRECNHRISNGLQIMAALMRVQIRAVEDNISKDILQIAASRIEAMGKFHRHLTISNSPTKSIWAIV